MKTRELTKFDIEDLKNLRVFKSILLKANFPLTGDAIKTVASLISWYESLELKIEDAMKKDKLDGAPKIGSIE